MLNLLEISVNDAVSKVCPIDGISFGKLDDKSTWRIDYTKDATDEQKAEAKKVLMDFVLDDNEKERYRKENRNQKYSDDLLMKKSYIDYKVNFPDATFSQFLDYLESIKLS